MALLDLLTDSNAYNINYGGPSKSINFLGNQGIPNYHLQRVSWDVNDTNADPTYEVGRKTFKNKVVDGMVRGGYKAHIRRQGIDFQRISKFLADPEQGTQFMLRQGILQSQNPQPNQRIWSPGNLLAQIAGGGFLNIKRSGLLPIPAGMDNVLSPTYLSYFDKHEDMTNLGQILTSKQNVKGVKPREKTYGMGSPGESNLNGTSGLESITGLKNPFGKYKGYNASFEDSYKKIDLINRLDIIKGVDGALPNDIEPFAKDMVNFRFEVIDSDNFSQPNFIIFRALIDSFDDKFSANHTSYKYNGRGEKFYIYNSFDRSISLSFKIAAQSRHEMKPLYRKLNYLAAQTAPNYGSSHGRIRTPFMKLTVGDYFNRLPGVLTSVNINWSNTYSWEIASHDEWDEDMKVLPHVLEVSINFQPIHDFTPDNSIGAKYIGIGEWLDEGAATHKGEAGLKETAKEKRIRENQQNSENKRNNKENQEGNGNPDLISAGGNNGDLGVNPGFDDNFDNDLGIG